MIETIVSLPVFAPLFIIGLNLLVYAKTCGMYMIVDDMAHSKSIQDGFFNQKKILSKIRSRLYGCGTFARKIPCKEPQCDEKCGHCSGKGYVWSWSIAWDHAFTVALHTLASVLIYFAFGANQISFLASLLYSVNPINNQTAIWLNGRRYLICVILTLLMLFKPFGILAYLFMPLFQVTAIFAPILYGWQYAILPLIVAFFMRDKIAKVIRKRFENIKVKDRIEIHPRRLIMVVKYYGSYFFRMILPGNTMMIYPGDYYKWGQSTEGNKQAYAINWSFYKGILALAVTGALPFVLPQSMFYMWLFMVLSTLQWCAIIPVTQDLSDRYTSIPTIFMMYFIAYLLPPVAVLILIAVYITQLHITMRMYGNMHDYWRYQEFFAQHLTWPRAFKINYLIKKSDINAAWVEVKEGLRHNPRDYTFLKMGAVLSHGCGDLNSARSFITAASQNIPFGYEQKAKEDLENLAKLIDETENVMEQHSRDMQPKSYKPKGGAFGKNN